jgi:hypothetical protein
MSSIGSKPTCLRLESDFVESLRQRVLCHDRWWCQSCGRMSNLEVHHQTLSGSFGR